MQKKYLFASASAVSAAFLSITLYPEHHGMKPGPSWGLFLLGGAVLALLVYIVYKATTSKEPPATPETSEDNERQTVEHDPARQKKMFFLWSLFTVVLSVSLLRYPIAEVFKEGKPLGMRIIFSAVCGVLLIGLTGVHVLRTVKK